MPTNSRSSLNKQSNESSNAYYSLPGSIVNKEEETVVSSEQLEEYEKLLTDVSLEQYLKTAHSNKDKYATFIVYKKVFELYKRSCEKQGVEPSSDIKLKPSFRLNNNNSTSKINNYYKDDMLCVKKIQLLYKICMVPNNTNNNRIKKKYILEQTYEIINNYMISFMHEKRTELVPENIKNSIRICFAYVDYVKQFVLLLQNSNNNRFLGQLFIRYMKLYEYINRAMREYVIRMPPSTEYKDTLLEFEDILESLRPVEVKQVGPASKEVKQAVVKSHAHKVSKENIPTNKILFINYNQIQ